VDREHPDVYVDLRIVKNVSTIGINISGERLFKRGYRTDTGPAPVKETLAAGIMDFVKPEAFGRLIDPMAGSGTLAIEAASRVLGLPAGRFRKRFGFERVKGFDAKSFASVRSGILTSAVEKSGNAFRCQCSDISDKVLPVCRQNIRNAGLSDIIEVRRADFFSTAPTGPAGVAVFNPPYGLRMQEEEDIGEFYKRIGDTLKKDWSGWTIWILTEKGEHMKRIGLRPSRKVELYNGAVECRLLKFEMY
jgi:putative N6-adenine-specific DNA methylase